ncbi:MAG: hypothetical protein HKL91_01775 [Candidatus Eremiobacteraeota bacterium]|uniref:Uncharacterized protein n=1 Tax=mine drainage metagenome TaxID=410659 RepID=E6PFT4_9ZZZZ|nr:hypothetical protein [Candidatus Eremiobacteraeota bacterium]
MPRSIIDTESSRPTYRRRLLLRAFVAVIALAGIVLALWFFHRAHGARLGQGKIGAERNLNQLALKETSCFVV